MCCLIIFCMLYNTLQVPYAGGTMQGEFAGAAATGVPLPEDGGGDDDDGPSSFPAAKLHSFSASMGLICHRDALQA